MTDRQRPLDRTPWALLSLAHPNLPNRRTVVRTTYVLSTFLLGVRLGRDVGPEHGALRALELDGAHLVGVRVRVRT